MYVYLVRHAIAFEPDSSAWPDDRERPLTPAGQKRFRRAARGLRTLVPSVDLMLSSPLTRAWQTAEVLQQVARWPAPTRFEPLEPGRAPEEVLEALIASGAEHYGDGESMEKLHSLEARYDAFMTEATAAFEKSEEWAAEGAKSAASWIAS